MSSKRNYKSSVRKKNLCYGQRKNIRCNRIEAWGTPHVYYDNDAVALIIDSNEYENIPNFTIPLEAINPLCDQLKAAAGQSIATGINQFELNVDSVFGSSNSNDLSLTFRMKEIRRPGQFPINLVLRLSQDQIFQLQKAIQKCVDTVADEFTMHL